jgi:drug/metabolite transporter (DMT)-like permease
MIPLVLVVDRPWTLAMPGLDIWAATVGMVLVSTVFAYVLYFRLVERAGASNSLLVTFTIPIVAILLGFAVLGEALLPKHLLGMALIALGLAAIDGRLFARWRRLP